ncbi:MAG: ECF transporter S component [Synergistaceae bacterium]|jgi:uncharacterized membrane protein|nr:ECF transporter S component [Synergistaceae bacterium]
MNKTSSLIRNFAITSLFAAIIFMMAFTPIGFIPLGPMNATIIHVPVIIGALLLGPKTGALLGSLFGLTSLMRANLYPNVLSFAFSPLIPLPGTDEGSVWALAICFVPRILVGIVPCYVDKFLRRFSDKAPWRFTSAFIAGVAGSMTNTLLVMYMIFAIFRDSYATALNESATAAGGLILTVIAVHGIPEAIIAGIFTSAVCRAVHAFLEKK